MFALLRCLFLVYDPFSLKLHSLKFQKHTQKDKRENHIHQNRERERVQSISFGFYKEENANNPVHDCKHLKTVKFLNLIVRDSVVGFKSAVCVVGKMLSSLVPRHTKTPFLSFSQQKVKKKEREKIIPKFLLSLDLHYLFWQRSQTATKHVFLRWWRKNLLSARSIISLIKCSSTLSSVFYLKFCLLP